jgi:adenylate cyclase
LEIERKFLVLGEPWVEARSHLRLRQGYLASGGPVTVRVRVGPAMAWLTVKGPMRGISREEFEFTIPRADGEAMLALCGDAVVEKTRHHVTVGRHCWEIDVFEGANEGLVVAEIELEHEEEEFVRPDWLGEEVSFDRRYRNSALSKRPYSAWED